MGLLRRRGGDDGTKYRMREKMFAVGDDFWIENEEGERAFKVDGKALRVRDTLVLEDASSGGELYKIQEKKLTIRDKMEIERGGATVATVKKALITPLRDRFSIEVEGGEDMEAKGNIVDHETRSNGAATRSRRCPSAGSGSATPTASRSRRTRTTRSSSPSASASTRWPAAEPSWTPRGLWECQRAAGCRRALNTKDGGRRCPPRTTEKLNSIVSYPAPPPTTYPWPMRVGLRAPAASRSMPVRGTGEWRHPCAGGGLRGLAQCARDSGPPRRVSRTASADAEREETRLSPVSGLLIGRRRPRREVARARPLARERC